MAAQTARRSAASYFGPTGLPGQAGGAQAGQPGLAHSPLFTHTGSGDTTRPGHVANDYNPPVSPQADPAPTASRNHFCSMAWPRRGIIASTPRHRRHAYSWPQLPMCCPLGKCPQCQRGCPSRVVRPETPLRRAAATRAARLASGQPKSCSAPPGQPF